MPYRFQYPLAFHAFTARRHKLMLLNPAAHGFVCVTDAEDTSRFTYSDGTHLPQGTVIGYAWWIRGSPSTNEDPWIKGRCASWSDAIERRLTSLEGLYEHYCRPNPIFSPEKLRVYNEDLASDERMADMMKLPHWHLGALAVRPEAQGRGAGRLLLTWGQDLAQQSRTWEEMHQARSATQLSMPSQKQLIALVATPKGRRVYEKAGFIILCDETGEPTVSPRIGSFPPHYFMIWEPASEWTYNVLVNDEQRSKDVNSLVAWKVAAAQDVKSAAEAVAIALV